MRMLAAATFTLLPLSASDRAAARDRSRRSAGADRPSGRCDAASPATASPVSSAPSAVLRPAGPSRARRLGRAAAGDLDLTVQRRVNGCIEPVIVRRRLWRRAIPQRRDPRRR